MSKSFGVTNNPDEMNTIYQNLVKLHNATTIENTEKVAEGIIQRYENSLINKPIGVLINEVKKYDH